MLLQASLFLFNNYILAILSAGTYIALGAENNEMTAALAM